MTRGVYAGAALVAGLLGVLLAGADPHAAAASAEERLIEVAPAIAVVRAPAPGHSQEWRMTVTNTSRYDLPIALEVTGDAEAPLLSGEHPLRVTLTGSDGAVIAQDLPAAQLLDSPSPLPGLPAGASYSVTGAASLPAAADNRYAGASGELAVRFIASASSVADQSPSRPLSRTGGVVLGTLLTAGVLLAGGIALLRRKAHRS